MATNKNIKIPNKKIYLDDIKYVGNDAAGISNFCFLALIGEVLLVLSNLRLFSVLIGDDERELLFDELSFFFLLFSLSESESLLNELLESVKILLH